MGRRIFSKPLSKEGRDNFDKIDWTSKLIEPLDPPPTDEDTEQDEREEQK